MSPADPVILDFLIVGGRRLFQTPASIARNIGYSRSHVQHRLPILEEHGLVEKDEKGYYWLTERGIDLMTNQIEPEAVEAVDEDLEE